MPGPGTVVLEKVMTVKVDIISMENCDEAKECSIFIVLFRFGMSLSFHGLRMNSTPVHLITSKMFE